MADLRWKLVLGALARLPQGAISRLVGRLADLTIPRALRRPVLGTFARLAGIDVTEAAEPIDAYATLDAFFVRRLRADVRSWPDAPDVIASPTDGILGALGRIEDGTLVQAKGIRYSAADLLADPAEAGRFDGGSFVTVYLSPRHYHRIHAPVGGAIATARHVPGRLLPVNAPAVVRFPDLFARNERVVCEIEAASGPVAVVAVGAINVGRISVAFDSAWVGPTSPEASRHEADAAGEVRVYRPPRDVRRGAEIMAFHLGSTVVLLIGPDAPPLRPELEPGREIRLGSPLTHGG